MSEDAQNDDEDDGCREPRPELIGVHDLVAEESDEQRADRHDDDASIAWDVVIDGVDELSSNDTVDCAPSESCEEIETGD